MTTHDNIVWIDLEMTGLDISKDRIIEVACIVTDGQLNTLEATDNIVVQCEESLLAGMDAWCTQHHTESGLVARVRASTTTMKAAEDAVLEVVRKHCPEGKCPLGGSSNFMDRLFLREQMPRLEAYLHYRNVDVSALKEVVRRFNPSVCRRAPPKCNAHRALSDITETIDELRYYLRTAIAVDTTSGQGKQNGKHSSKEARRKEELASRSLLQATAEAADFPSAPREGE